jgi:hypothetical protein
MKYLGLLDTGAVFEVEKLLGGRKGLCSSTGVLLAIDSENVSRAGLFIQSEVTIRFVEVKDLLSAQTSEYRAQPCRRGTCRNWAICQGTPHE